MKKILGKKEKGVIVNFILYILISIIGVILLKYPAVGVFEPMYYMSALFYIIAFFGVISHFITRKEEDYEDLFFALICVIVGSFLFIFKNDNKGFILGTSIVIMTLGIIIVKGYSIYILSEEKNNMWFIKFVVTFIIGFLGVLVTINLYKEITLQTMMFGYYFLTFGIINLLDPVYELLLRNKSFNEYMSDLLEDNERKPVALEPTKPVKAKKQTPKPKKQITKPKNVATKKFVKKATINSNTITKKQKKSN